MCELGNCQEQSLVAAVVVFNRQATGTLLIIIIIITRWEDVDDDDCDVDESFDGRPKVIVVSFIVDTYRERCVLIGWGALGNTNISFPIRSSSTTKLHYPLYGGWIGE